VRDQLAQGARELVRAHFVVSLAEDMKGVIQGVLGGLIRQSLAEARQQRRWA